MTTLIKDSQKLADTSAYIELFEIEISDGSFVYFHSENTVADLYFRNRFNPAVINTYVNIPAEFSGFEVKSEGAASRPRITISNVLSTFEDLTGLDEDELVGKRFTRRTTRYKFLYGQASDSNPPREYPIHSYIIDRIDSKNAIGTVFELSTPFDLAGVTLPRRQIVQGMCNWTYQGAGPDLNEGIKRGGCAWRTDSKIFLEGSEYQPFFDSNDLPIIPDSEYTVFSGSSTKDSYYRKERSLVRYNGDGTFSEITGHEFWQAKLTGSAAIPSIKEDQNWRMARPYKVWSSGNTYYAYTNPFFNEIVLYDNKLWKTRFTTSTTTAPTYGLYWDRVDLCSKRLTGCDLRFGFKPRADDSPSSVDTINRKKYYGGFSSSRVYGN